MIGTAGEKVGGSCRARYQEQTHRLLQKRERTAGHMTWRRCWLALLLIWLVKETLGFV